MTSQDPRAAQDDELDVPLSAPGSPERAAAMQAAVDDVTAGVAAEGYDTNADEQQPRSGEEPHFGSDR